jgi:hypothetical protein
MSDIRFIQKTTWNERIILYGETNKSQQEFEKMSEKTVNSVLRVKATAALDEEVKKELEEEDPTLEKAIAILTEAEGENTKGNDRE